MIHPTSTFARRSAARLVLAALFAAAAVLSLSPARAAAQDRLSGRVERQGQGVPGIPVTLHRVTRDSAGVVHETLSGADGAFTFVLPRAPADSAGFTVFLTTAEKDGVRYFGAPIHPGQVRGDSYAIAVNDTTSSAAALDSVSLVRREVALLPLDGGGWEVGELVRVANRSTRAIVPAAGRPAIGFSLPPGVEEVDVQQGDLGPEEVVTMGDRVLITSALRPGEQDVVFRYVLPAGTGGVTLKADFATDTLNLYVRQPAPEVTVRGLSGPEAQAVQGVQFVRFTTAGLERGATVSARWEVPITSVVDPRWAALALAGLVLAVGAWAALRRRDAPSSPAPAAPGPREGKGEEEEAGRHERVG